MPAIKCEAFGYYYSILPRSEFDEAGDLLGDRGETQELQARASPLVGAWVLFDPDDGPEGLLLVGHNPEALSDDARAFHSRHHNV